MPNHEPESSRVVSVRLPDDLIQRLDRYLDWSETYQRLKSTRNAAMREALSLWLDDQEQRAGLMEPHILQRQFQATYDRLSPRHDWVPIYQLRHLLRWPRERFDAVVEALRAAHQVELDTLESHPLRTRESQDSYHVHGQLYSQLRWCD